MSSGIRKACRRCTCRYYYNTNKSRSLIRGSSTLRNLAHTGRSKSMVPYFFWITGDCISKPERRCCHAEAFGGPLRLLRYYGSHQLVLHHRGLISLCYYFARDRFLRFCALLATSGPTPLSIYMPRPDQD